MTDPRVISRLGESLRRAGRLDEALACFERVVALEPRGADGYLGWALCLQQEELTDEAVDVLRLGLDNCPDGAELAFLLAALGGAPPPDRAPEAFVTQHFDRLAPSFDQHLRVTLRYKAPELLVALLTDALEPGRHDLAILDAGCGTGLCGPLLRPLAGRLVGLDLSAGMLEQASARGVYDELVQGELVRALAVSPAAYDLIVAADVLIYFGDLVPLFRAAAVALRPGGLLAVSIEHAKGADYVLHAGARFAHAPDYVRRVADAVGLRPVAARECTLRLELGQPVAGLLSVMAVAE